MLMESKPRTIYWFSLSQKKKHLNRIREIQFRETSADTERIKYNSNGIKTWSSKKIQEKSKLNPVEQQDSVTLLLKFSKSLLQMHKTSNRLLIKRSNFSRMSILRAQNSISQAGAIRNDAALSLEHKKPWNPSPIIQRFIKG